MNDPLSTNYEQARMKCRETDVSEWLDLQQPFTSGAQAFTGLFVHRENDALKYVYKVSRYMDYLVEHEATAMQALGELAEFCPHFCRLYSTVKSSVTLEGKSQHPFLQNKHCVKSNVLLMEYIDNACELAEYMGGPTARESVIYSAIKQVVLAITLAQRFKQLTHYDLHSSNIMLQKCPKDVVLLYVLDAETAFAVPTHGYIPKIIDYGFAYVGDMQGSPMTGSLSHSDSGFTPYTFDEVSDLRLFLVSASDDVKDFGSQRAKKLRNIARNLYEPLRLDWKNGWDKAFRYSVHTFFGKIFDKYNLTSLLFREWADLCYDLFLSMVQLPLEKHNYENVEMAYRSFVEEFTKIEREVSSSFYCMYILRQIIDLARNLKTDYARKRTRGGAVDSFRKSLFDVVHEVAKFCRLREVNYEKKLCALYVLSTSMEGIMYEIAQSITKYREKIRGELVVTDPENIYALIAYNIPDTYLYSTDTQVVVLDARERKRSIFQLSGEDVQKVNAAHELSRGMVLLGMYDS